MCKKSLLALLFLCFLILFSRGEDTIRHYKWEVKYKHNSVPTMGPLWNDTKSLLPTTPPRSADGVIMLRNAQNKIDGSSRLPTTSCVLAPKEKTNAFNQNRTPNAYNFVNYCIYNFTENGNGSTGNCTCEIHSNTVVDLILQNADAMTVNDSEMHLLHLHGNHFWVLGYGIGKYNISEDWKKYNLVNPIMKNTVRLHPYGWTAVRFRVYYAGAWAFHFSLIPV